MLNKDYIYIIETQDKPIKLCFENNLMVKTEKYTMSLEEVLLNEVRNIWSNSKITGQQYKVEKGKIKKGYSGEVLNFLIKRGITKEYINNEVNQERDIIIFSKSFNVSDFINDTLGVITLR